MSRRLALYGTEAPPPSRERFTLGPLSFTLEEGGLRHICLADQEMIRGVSFLVRDRDWGTLAPDLTEEGRQVDADEISLRFRAVYRSGGATLEVALDIRASAQGLSFEAEGVSRGGFETNRTGFTVLHPAGLAGCRVKIRHGIGQTLETVFPQLIDPWQPFMDIAAITHIAEGLRVGCTFAGDTFETEDQRQWGDASFKTYNRPLAKPWPYVLDEGAAVAQSVRLDWERLAAAVAAPERREATGEVVFAQTALSLTPECAERLAQDVGEIADVAPQRLLCSIETGRGDVLAQCRAFGVLQERLEGVALDLELICAFEARPAEELQQVRALMDDAGFAPESVLVCPAVDRQSTPPGSQWPDCPPLEEVHGASAEAFAGMWRGGGVVSFFPELNRKRPPVDAVDFVSHGLCPIVHAADDLSVMETLETVPHITRSTRAIIGEREYRIGPATLAMRHNPYGRRTIPNPERGRICMADDDPRHGAAFGAAYTMGLACALAPTGVTVWTPSELYGPRGLAGHQRAAVAALARLAGAPVKASRVEDGIGELRAGAWQLRVNLTAEPLAGLEPFEWEMEG